MADTPYESQNISKPDLEAASRLRSDADLGVLPKAGMDKIQVAGWLDWFGGSKKNEDEVPLEKKSEPSGNDKLTGSSKDERQPTEEGLKAFEANKDKIKKECEEKNGAGSQQCDDKQSLLPRSGTDSLSGANTQSHSSSGINTMLLYYWLYHGSGSSTPGYYQNRAPSLGVTPQRRDDSHGTGGAIVGRSTPAARPEVAPAGRNPVTGIPNTGRPSGFGSTGGARGVGGSA